MTDTSTPIRRHVKAPREQVYRAIVDADAVTGWMVPTGMTSHVREFDAGDGGRFRISLTYDEPIGTGKATTHGDTYHDHFVEVIPRGLSAADNETGWRMTRAKLAGFVEAGGDA